MLLHTLRPRTSKSLHLILLNLNRTWIIIRTGKGRVQPNHPNRDPLSSLSLPTSSFRLQALYREIFHVSRLFPQRLFPLFYVKYVVTTSLPLAPAYRVMWGDGKMQDLECVEIWKRLARNDQFRHRREHPSVWVAQNSRFRDPGVVRVRKDGDLRELRTRGHKS